MRVPRDICAYLRGAVADIAVDRRADLRVAEVELSGAQVGLRLGEARLGFGDLGVDDRQLLLGGIEVGLPGTHRGGRLAVGGKRLLVVLHRAEGCQRQRVVAGGIDARIAGLGLVRRQLGLGLLDHRLLQRVFRMQIGERRRLVLNDRFGMRESGLVIAVVERDHELRRL